MTKKGKSLYGKLESVIPSEMNLDKCSVTLGERNHAILVKGLGDGIEQRDAVIKMGALRVTTLIFQDKKILIPDRNKILYDEIQI